MIKIIWQTHEWEYSDLPEHFRAATTAWKNLNPTWDYRYVSARGREDQVKSFDYNLYKFYVLADKVTQADLWRYIAVYENGGAYADMDSICTAPLDYTLEKNYNSEEVLATAPDEDITTSNNANFYAVKNSKIIKTVIDNIFNRYRNITLYQTILIDGGNQDLTYCIQEMLRTGPGDYSDVLMKNKDKVCFKLTGVGHGEELKHNFYPDYIVDYYGQEQKYSDLVKEKGWSFT
jgi:mannosyltransferase OCH1-like enzyme